MMRRFLALMLALFGFAFTSAAFVACDNDSDLEDAAEDVEDSIEDAGDEIEDATDR